MRKHPLIALIAFTFVAASIFIGTAGASSINAIPVRATSHLAKGESASTVVPTANLRWLAAAVHRARVCCGAARGPAAPREKYSPFWQGLAVDRVAIHDGETATGTLLPRDGVQCRRQTLVSPQAPRRRLKQHRRHKLHKPNRRHKLHKPNRRHKLHRPNRRHKLHKPNRRHKLHRPNRRHKLHRRGEQPKQHGKHWRRGRQDAQKDPPCEAPCGSGSANI